MIIEQTTAIHPCGRDRREFLPLSLKKLAAGQPFTDSETIWGGGTTNIPIELNQFEWIQGEIWAPYFSGVIQDPNGVVVKDFGAIQDNNFTLKCPEIFLGIIL